VQRAQRPTVEEVEQFDVIEEDGGEAKVVTSVTEHLITEMFPGATEIK